MNIKIYVEKSASINKHIKRPKIADPISPAMYKFVEEYVEILLFNHVVNFRNLLSSIITNVPVFFILFEKFRS